MWSHLIRIIGVVILAWALLAASPQAEETNDLWYLISSYEDTKMTTDDLATFLTAHGYQASPQGNYVTASVSGKKLYLKPNGASQGLADVFLIPPSGADKISDADEPHQRESNDASALTRVANSLEIKKGITYAKTNNREFINGVREAALFPVTPYGMCFEGSRKMGRIYTDLGYDVMYMYNPDNPKGQGHEWILVKDGKDKDLWQAVDSYYGTMDDSNYYYAPYSFPRQDHINYIMPQLIV